MSNSSTIIENPHPGFDFRADLFEASDVSVVEAAAATGLSEAAINGFLDGTHRVDAEFDLRLGRWFGFSPGYFLRLQNAFDLDEVTRLHAAELASIRPRIDQAA